MMKQDSGIRLVNRFVFIDIKNWVFCERVLDIYKDDVFFHRVPLRYKDVMIKLLKSSGDMKNGS